MLSPYGAPWSHLHAVLRLGDTRGVEGRPRPAPLLEPDRVADGAEGDRVETVLCRLARRQVALSAQPEEVATCKCQSTHMVLFLRCVSCGCVHAHS